MTHFFRIFLYNRVHFFFLVPVLLCTTITATAQHAVPVYPDTTWMKFASPEEAGWSANGIDRARAYADSVGSKAVMLVYKGAVVAEWGPVGETAPIRSIRKSLFSGLLGIAVDEGIIDLSSTLAELEIDDTPSLSEAEKQAQVSHLLTTSSGVYHKAAGEPPALQKPDRGSAEPGEQWYYNNWDFNVLGTIYEEQTGKGIFRAFDEQIARPTGMEAYHPDWGSYMHQPDRSEHPAYNLWMSARDMARFGLLYLNNGRWDGRQIIPSEWVERSSQIHQEVPGEHVAGYGLSWWIPAGPLQEYETYTASGAGNQSIMILPERDIVFVHRASAVLEEGVNGLEAREILFQLLNAQTDDEADKPELVPVAR